MDALQQLQQPLPDPHEDEYYVEVLSEVGRRMAIVETLLDESVSSLNEQDDLLLNEGVNKSNTSLLAMEAQLLEMIPQVCRSPLGIWRLRCCSISSSTWLSSPTGWITRTVN